MRRASKQSAPPFLPPEDIPSFGRKQSSSPLDDINLGVSLRHMLYAYTFGMFGPWLITIMSGVLLTALYVYWFSPDDVSIVVRSVAPEFLQGGWDTISGFGEWVRSWRAE